MLQTTFQILKSGLQGDPTLSPLQRTKLLAAFRQAEKLKAEPVDESKQRIARIVRRKEAAQMYSCSTRLIDRLAAQGALRKVTLPGRKRSAGFLESDLLALITAANKAEAA